MAKVVQKESLSVKGILNIKDNKLLIEIEDAEKPFDLAELAESFDGKDVSISVSCQEELA